ncbi:hypothetical protein SAMN04487980_10069 [Streptomyces sp. cf124]|nr:hypothetical protein SAMN04487980_10069 [Streptomyces sp. cf124]
MEAPRPGPRTRTPPHGTPNRSTGPHTATALNAPAHTIHPHAPPHSPSRTKPRAGRPTPHAFGLNVFVKVRQVSLRSSPLHFAALAVYISAYPCRESTTNPRSIDRFFVPLST